MFNKKKSLLALDIGSHSVKLLELVQDKTAMRLTKWACREIDPQCHIDSTNVKEINQATINCILGLFSELTISPHKIENLVTCLPGSQVSIKQIKSIPLSAEELSSSLVFEARKHLPVEGEVLMDYQVLGKDGQQLDILLVVTAKQIVVNHSDLISSCGLKTGVIDAPPLAIVNSLLLNTKAANYGSAVIINIGASSTTICIHSKKRMFFCRDIPIGGKQFTDDIKSRDSISTVEAEAKKKQEGIFPKANNQNQQLTSGLSLSLANKPGSQSVDALSREILRSIRFYLKETSSASIEQFYAVGGCSMDEEMLSYLSQSLGTTIQPFNPFSWMSTEPEIECKAQYAQAMGMALRGVHGIFRN